MPKKTKPKVAMPKKKTSIKQKQKVKVIVNVKGTTDNKTAKAKQGRRSSAPRQPQQIIIQQPSMISRELPMPMFNPIQQASAPPVFQGVGQSLQTPTQLLNIIREAPEFENLNRVLNIQAKLRKPNFENYSQMPYMETNLQAPQFEDPAEIQREVIDTTPIFQEPSSFDAKLQARFQKAMENRRRYKNNNSNFINVNATNKGFEEPVPQEVALQETLKGLSFDPLVKRKPNISFSPVASPVPSEDGNADDENAVVPPVVTSEKKRRGRPKITPPTINQGKIDSDIYNTIINAEDDEFASDKLFPLKELNKLLAGIGIDPEDFDYRYQKVNRLKQWRNEQRS
jgi:hypothetical protein